MQLGLYELIQHYGGPEEGGWWFDTWHYVDTPWSKNDIDAMPKAQIAIQAQKMKDWAENQDWCQPNTRLNVMHEPYAKRWQKDEYPTYE